MRVGYGFGYAELQKINAVTLHVGRASLVTRVRLAALVGGANFGNICYSNFCLLCTFEVLGPLRPKDFLPANNKKK